MRLSSKEAGPITYGFIILVHFYKGTDPVKSNRIYQAFRTITGLFTAAMKEKVSVSKKILQHRLDDLLSGKQVKTDDLSNESIEWLIHELQEHQTELHFQNQELRETQSKLAASRDHFTEQLLESKQNLSVLFEQSPIAIWEEDFSQVKSYLDHLKSSGISDFQDYFIKNPLEVRKLADMVRITQVNETSLYFYGVDKKEELLETRLQDWFSEDSWRIFTAELISLAQGQIAFKGEVKVNTPLGESKTLLLKLSVPLTYRNTLEKVIVSFMDITELKNVQEALIKEKQLARMYLQIANAMILILDKKGKILRINQKSCEVLGYTEEQIVGKNWFDHFIPNEARAEIKNVHNQVISGNAIALEFYENDILVKGNKLRVIEWHNAVIRDEEGAVSGVISSGVDITERRKAQAASLRAIHRGQEEERKRIAQELHDGLGQQLAASKMLLSSLEPDLENLAPDALEVFKTAVQILNQAVEEARHISHNLAPIALSKTGLFSAMEKLCTLTSMASICDVQFSSSGSDKKINEPVAIGLYRIVQELLSNVIKHAGATEARVCVKQHRKEVHLVVQDDGKGFRGDLDMNQTSGIGLKNIKSRISGLGGRITIDSCEGAGTSINVIIPMN